MHLVIIEAPGKLKKLRSLLPSIRPDVTWQVEATAGHIRDLPVHGQDPQMLTVGVGQDFKPHYQILSGKEKTVARLKDLQQKALEIYVASDPDREGETSSRLPGSRTTSALPSKRSPSHASAPNSARRVAWTSRRSPRRNAVASSIAWWGIWSRQSCGA